MTVKERQAAMLAAQQETQDSELSKVLTSMHSQLQSMQEQQDEIAKTVGQLVTTQNGNTRVIEELISRAPETSSASPQSEIAQLQNSVREVGETLKLLSETVSGSQAVQLPSGEKVKRSDLDALSLARETSARVEAMTSSVDGLAAAVKAKARVAVDADKVAAVVVGRVASASEERVAALFDVQEQRLTELGEVQGSQVATRLQEATAVLAKADARMERLPRALTWQGVGNVALALLPFALVTLVFAQLLGLAGGMLGVGPLFGWAWESFVAAPGWWQKVLIAVPTLAAAGAAFWLVFKLGRVVAETYKGWR